MVSTATKSRVKFYSALAVVWAAGSLGILQNDGRSAIVNRQVKSPQELIELQTAISNFNAEVKRAGLKNGVGSLPLAQRFVIRPEQITSNLFARAQDVLKAEEKASKVVPEFRRAWKEAYAKTTFVDGLRERTRAMLNRTSASKNRQRKQRVQRPSTVRHA